MSCLVLIGAGVDYDFELHNVTFPAGVTRVSFDTVIVNDISLENDEEFVLYIYSLPAGIIDIYPFLVAVTIVDDDGNVLLLYT